MRTGAIFARGSCRALKWTALLGMVFALGAASAVAQPGNLGDAVITIAAPDSVDTGSSATVTVTVAGELPPAIADGNTATTVTVTVTASALAGDSTDTDFAAQQTALAALDDMSPYNAVTPAEDGDYTILDDTSNTDQTTGLVEIVLGPNTNTTRSIDVSGSGTFQLLGRDADADAENEALRLSVTAVTASGLDAADPPQPTTATVELRTALTADGGAVMDDIVINDPQTQQYVLTASGMEVEVDAAGDIQADEGDEITIALTADPAHVQGTEVLTLQHDMMALVETFGVAVTTGATSDGTPVSGSSVTIGSGGTDSGSTTSATITIGTKADDDNRVDDKLTLTAYSGQVGAAIERATKGVDLADLHMLPMVKAILVDATGTALNPQPAMVTEGMDYMLKLIAVDDEGMALTTRFAEELTVTLTQTGDADPMDDYSLGASTITIPSGAVESAAITLEVDLNDDLDDESLILMGVVNGEDTEYGPPQPGLNPMEVLSLTIMDDTTKHIEVAAGAEAAINAIIMTAMQGDGQLNIDDDIFIDKDLLFETAPGYTARVDASSSDEDVAYAADQDFDDGAGVDHQNVRIYLNRVGTATITITGTAVPAGSSFATDQVSVDVAEITFDVTVELAIPPMVQGLDAEPGDGQVTLSWDALPRRYSVTRYEYDVDASDNWVSAGMSTSVTVPGLTNGTRYVFRVRAVNAAGAGDSTAGVGATPVAGPLEPQVLVKSVSATDTSVPEAAGLEVTVTATVPAGTKGADGKVAPIAERTVAVSFPTHDASIAAGDEAEAEDLTVLGSLVWQKIPRTEKASEATFKFRVAIGQDLDAEDEKFQVAVAINGDAKSSKVITIDDAQEQTFVLSLPTAAKGAIKEGAAATTLTLKADPAKTFDIPVSLILNPNDPSKYTLGALSADSFGVNAVTATIAALADTDRENGTVTVSAYTPVEGELTSLAITVTDANALPAVKATLVGADGKALDPQPESVMEGETLKVMLTVVDKDGKAMKAAEKLSVSLIPTSGSSQDYRLSMHPIVIESGKESSSSVDLMIEADDDVGMEMLVLDASVAGDPKNGAGTNPVAGVLSLSIEDGTMKLVEAKTEDEIYAIFNAAKDAGMGGDGLNPGETIEFDASMMFTSAPGTTVVYSVNSDNPSVASAIADGGTGATTITANAAGPQAHITVTATASAASGVQILDQTSPYVAQIVLPVDVVLEPLTVTVEADPTEITEGETSTLTAMANRPVAEATMIALSVIGDEDAYEVSESITIAANASSGTALLVASQDDDYMAETLTVVATGPGIDGAQQIIISVMDDDEAPADTPTVSAKSQEQVDAVFATAIANARSGSEWSVGDNAATLDMRMLFDVMEGSAPTYSGMSSDEMVLSASSSGTTLTLSPMAAGMATITVTASDADTGDIATAMSDVTVAALPLSVTVSASAEMVEEGGTITVTATANQMVAANTEVMLMRDGASSAGEDDYSLEPPLITIMAGDDTGSLTLTATDDDDMEGTENLTLHATVGDMSAGSVMIEIIDNDMAITYTLTGPEDMNLVEGLSAELTVTASSAARKDTEVMLMRDGASTASADDYTVDSVMIMAGETTGTTMVMVVEDDMMENANNMPEMLTLFLVVDGMQMTDKSVTFYLWDAAVPALPVIAQLLLAAFLAVGGYRRYRRR